MTENNLLDLLRDAVERQGSQARVAKMLGYSSATISQILSGKYQGELDNFLTKVEEIFGTRDVACPVSGTIPLNECVRERRTPFSTSNPRRVQMYRACLKCPFNTDSTKEKI